MQKNMRPVLIRDYLMEHTDARNWVTVEDINQHLEPDGIDAHPDTIKDTIKELIRYGIPVALRHGGNGCNEYAILQREFTPQELRLLCDAVQAFPYMPEQLALDISTRLVSHLSKYEAHALTQHLYSGRHITPAPDLMSNILTIYEAISQHHQITFQYADYDHTCTRILKHGGRLYAVSPYSMFMYKDRYYMVGYYARPEPASCISKFRLDRMVRLRMEDRPSHPIPRDYDRRTVFEREFGMFSGTETVVRLRCRNDSARFIVDQFGLNRKFIPADEEHFDVSVPVCLSPQFNSWIFGLNGAVRIVAPTAAVECFNRQLQIFLSEQ